MSRRSTCLQAKQHAQPSQTDSPQEAQIIQAKKRKQHRMSKKEEKHQYEIRTCWPPVLSGGVSPLIGTSDFSRFTNYRFKNLFLNPSPLPDLSWGCSQEVCLNMLKKENIIYEIILLDWLLEVCEVHTLHRETFYLAHDFFDRFMLTQRNINKNMLQLIGITSLFIASKLEEIHAPKLPEFAYVTDGACSEEDIVLKAVKWELCPVTVISCLHLFLQVDALKDAPKVLRQYSQETFILIAQLLDLILAAAALCLLTSIEVVKKASGLEWDNWMVPFVSVVKSASPVKLKTFKRIPKEDRHNIQTHANYLAMLDEVNYLSPVCNGGIMTPPKSTEKPPGKH
uniref:Cyclin-like domain-containing protein n=1 Tax=Cavia porcellus TaxID=10141 RepID=A0A286XN21_CAVPO